MPSILNNYSEKINNYFFNLKNEMKPRKPEEVRLFVNAFYKNKRYLKANVYTEDIELDHLKMRLYSKSKTSYNCIIYIHGGGFVFGDLSHIDPFVSDLCDKTGADVFSIDYRKAPEFIYPNAHKDIIKQIDLIINKNSKKYTSFYIMGCSAGAMLALHTTQDLQEPSKISGLILDSPAVSLNSNSKSFEIFEKGYFLDKKSFEYYMKLYFKDNIVEIDFNFISKINNIIIISCGYDPLSDQAFDLESKLRSNNKLKLKHAHFKEQLHGFSMLYYSFDIGLKDLPHWGLINEVINEKNNYTTT